MSKTKVRKKAKKPYKLLATVAGITVLGLSVALLFLFVFPHPPASAQEYPIKGFDVSHHQKEIRWKEISPQEYKFVYLKATEGGDYAD